MTRYPTGHRPFIYGKKGRYVHQSRDGSGEGNQSASPDVLVPMGGGGGVWVVSHQTVAAVRLGLYDSLRDERAPTDQHVGRIVHYTRRGGRNLEARHGVAERSSDDVATRERETVERPKRATRTGLSLAISLRSSAGSKVMQGLSRGQG